jgi:ATP-binding cassette, subfamily B, bacterial
MKRPAVAAGRRILLLAVLVANGCAQVATVIATGLLASRLVAEGPSGAVRVPDVLALLACAAALFALRWRERVDAVRLAQDYVVDLRRAMFARLWHADSQDVANRGQGALLLRLTGDVGALSRWIGQGLARLVVAGVVVTGVCGALLWLQPGLAALACLLSVVLAAGAVASHRHLDAAVRAARRRRGQLASEASDHLRTLPAIQASGAWRAEQARIERRSREVGDATIAEARWSATLIAGSEVLALLAPTLAILLLATPAFPAGGSVALPVVVLLFGLLVTPLRDSMRVFGLWRKARIAAEKIEQVLDLPRLPRARVSPPLKTGRVDELCVSAVPVVPGGPRLDLQAQRGSRVLVGGGTAASRSALLRLLVRLFDPAAGQVLVNDHDLRDVDIAALRRRVALVSPTLGLRRGSLRRLLRLRRPHASEQRLLAVLERCRIERWPVSLPQGLETRLRDGWPELSPYARLQLLVAQALIGQPDVLLIDDVDSLVPESRVHELRATLADFRGIVILASSASRWRSWATVLWDLDSPAPMLPPVLSA